MRIRTGYIFGLIIEACTKHQEKNKPTQADPVQLSAHFLMGADLVPYEVHTKTLKSGRSYTNICAEFFQEVSHSSHPLRRVIIYGDETQSFRENSE